ncbi:MAG TPA: carboxypeptidase regulatory-like domain-containing protein [Mycobacterium sp.]|nr:carboxypeptidase regulatory-like domain-containing protein [Mycobacterium sp.]
MDAACNHLRAPRNGRPFAQCFTTVWTNTPQQITANAAAPQPTALGPADIQRAYNLPASGHAQTVAIVDAYGDSAAEADLAAFRAYYGLPACTNANGCFQKVDQDGGTNYPPDNTNWALETSLDLDAVSAACPACHILLVQTRTNGIDSLGAGENTAVRLGAKYVSNSYGVAGENSAELGYDQDYDHPGVAIVAATGDTGNVTNWPASNPNVTAVGGTTLTQDGTLPRGWRETAWSSGGSGCSPYEPRPGYQATINTNCPNNKAIADIAADADPASGLAIYDSLGYGGWLKAGGTSLATPLVTAMYALAGTPEPGTYPVTYPYQSTPAGLFDITEGSDGGCGTVLCTAGPGWDGPTGLGVPDGVAALALAPHGDLVGTVTDAATGTPLAGATITTSDGYTATSDATGSYDLNVPAGNYDVTARLFGYQPSTDTGVQVQANATVSDDFTLTRAPEITITGTVTDGAGHGWPLYATVTAAGTPLPPVHTDPFTGRYEMRVPAGADYTLHVDPVYPGYLATDEQAAVGTTDLTVNAALAVDQTSCSAPGYAWRHGVVEPFTGWIGNSPQDGWTITDNAGKGQTWEFDNPGSRPHPPGGSTPFAIVDSANYGKGGHQDTSLVTPVVDLSNQSSPSLSFDTQYVAAHRQQAEVDLSLDGGTSWTTIWHTTTDAAGHVSIPIAVAGGHSAVRVRFRSSGQFGWWWSVDDVVFGARTCEQVSGGLVAGLVTDAAGAAINGATVASTAAPADHGTSAATPSDAGLPDGFYWLFASRTGAQPFTVTATGHPTASGTIDISADHVTRKDWGLT